MLVSCNGLATYLTLNLMPSIVSQCYSAHVLLGKVK